MQLTLVEDDPAHFDFGFWLIISSANDQMASV
jgi:hypothetical protein